MTKYHMRDCRQRDHKAHWSVYAVQVACFFGAITAFAIAVALS